MSEQAQRFPELRSVWLGRVEYAEALALQRSLFDRRKRPPALNPLGLALVPRAREILRAYDELLRSASDTRGLSGELTIGAVPTTMTGVVPKAISGLRAA